MQLFWKRFRLAFYVGCFTLLYVELSAQAPTIQDCLGAVPVCKDIYSETNSPKGDGAIKESLDFDGCVPKEENSIWYTFTVNRSGDFGFLITPNNIEDDYDWALYDITNAVCSDIIDNNDLVVSCNNAGGDSYTGSRNCDGLTGATGASSFNSIGAGCTPPNTPFNDFVPVAEGNIYVLFIVNWTGSEFGYTIDFSLGDAGIYDEEKPRAETSTNNYICWADGTGFSQVTLIFNENIQCSTIGASNFQITGSNQQHNFTISADECAFGAPYSKIFNVLIEPKLPAGSYTFDMTGNNTFEILDICDNPSLPFTTTFEYDACSFGNVLVVDCDDGDPGTIYDQQTVLACDTSLVCLPCMGRCGAFYDSNIALCEGDTILLNTGELVWKEGFYQATFPDVNGCDSVLRNYVTEWPKIDLQLNSEYYGFFDDVNILETSVAIPNPIYSWTPVESLSCADCANPEILVDQFYENMHQVTVTDADSGCQSSATVAVFITDYNELHLPNAFSPNSDGQNDEFALRYSGVLLNMQLAVYNRLGQQIFFSNDINTGWDGFYKNIAQPIGVYSYLVTGYFPNEVVLREKGNLTLIR